jgi:hypothetical protein
MVDILRIPRLFVLLISSKGEVRPGGGVGNSRKAENRKIEEFVRNRSKEGKMKGGYLEKCVGAPK